ncbi:MAG: tRNA pseudouridine(55) synthase TruB [Roseburia sp.]|nr:tRNA pseudouridine(55) synthase TruB [Roseburia sp.]MCM1279903.1 tRNA pseudouridine(55) synthase TruB [Robinsoniella sp.]
MIHGIINVYKEKGFTSHDVVAKLRGILKQKKIGHTGTLDPDAVGVLPVCLGSATKLCDMLTDRDKEYIAELQLGCVTDTQDMTGKVLKQSKVQQQGAEIRNVIMSFQGVSQQIPPMYSALKVNGKKLYELAREGKEIERKPRTIRITEIEIQKVQLPIVCMRVVCSKGTYIRTLCNDIGERLGCGGAMKSLIRSRVGEFTLEDALTLTQIEALRDEDRLKEKIVSVDAVFQEYPACIIGAQWKKLIENGNGFGKKQIFKMSGAGKETGLEKADGIRVYDEDGIFYGIYGWVKEKNRFEPIKMFLTKE